MKAVDFKDNQVRIFDQSLLPHEEKIIYCKTVEEVADAIKTMKVRGAPAIGVAAAYGMALADDLETASNTLKSARPTAVDLAKAVDYVLQRVRANETALEAARAWDQDIYQQCSVISKHGASLIQNDQTVLTHCNTGFLAANAYGTALGAIVKAWRDGKKMFVYVDETRPRFQGAITSWELLRDKVPHKVIVDSCAGFLMQKGKINSVFVGADRIVRNGDFANKIGTYSLAVLAKENNVPFYVLAPLSSFDFKTDIGESIEVEERNENEILEVLGKRIYPDKTHGFNLAFDVTPSKYVTSYVTDCGIFDKIGKVEQHWRTTTESSFR